MASNTIAPLDNFFSVFPRTVYKKKQILIHPNEPIDRIYFLKKGYIREYLISSEGEELTTHIFRPSSYIPLLLALVGKQNKYYFETVTEAEVYTAPVDKVTAYVKDHSDVEMEIIKRLGAGLGGLLIRIESLIFESVTAKTASLLVYLADRFGEKSDHIIAVNLPITHKEIANFIGASRETVSRQMEEFRNKGLINYRGKFLEIKEIKKLEAIAADSQRGKKGQPLLPKELNI